MAREGRVATCPPPVNPHHHTPPLHHPHKNHMPLSKLPTLQSVPLTRRLELSVLASAALVAACGGSDSNDSTTPPVASQPATATLAVLETTDLHFNVRSYDYFKLAEDASYGFERTATLVRAARKEFANTLLVDNGDTIQGTALADYEAEVAKIPCTQQLSMYKAMGALGFDAGTLGNHEFNYGLPFLNQVLGGGLDVDGVDKALKCAGNGFPMALSNVYSSKTKQPLVQPYVILERSEEHTSELQSPDHLVCRLLLEKKKTRTSIKINAPVSTRTKMIKNNQIRNAITFYSVLIARPALEVLVIVRRVRRLREYWCRID